jgi:oligopeptidase B
MCKQQKQVSNAWRFICYILAFLLFCGFTPHVEKVPHVYRVANYEIEDNYDWLRDKNWPEVKNRKILKYLEQENNYAEKNLFTKYKEEQKQVFNELQRRIKVAYTSEHTKKDNYYYYTRMEENKNYKIHCRKQGNLKAKEEIILDENLIA